MSKLPTVYYDGCIAPYRDFVTPITPVVSAEAVLASQRPDLAYDLLYTRDREQSALQRYSARYSAVSSIAQASALALVTAIDTRGDNSMIEIEGAEYEPGFLGIGRRANISFKWTVKFRK